MDILALILCICQVKKWIALYFFLTIVISIDFIEPHKLKVPRQHPQAVKKTAAGFFPPLPFLCIS